MDTNFLQNYQSKMQQLQQEYNSNLAALQQEVRGYQAFNQPQNLPAQTPAGIQQLTALGEIKSSIDKTNENQEKLIELVSSFINGVSIEKKSKDESIKK